MTGNLRKKLVAVIMVFALTLGSLGAISFSVLAIGGNWADEGNRDKEWTDGSISTPQQLAQFAYLVNNGEYSGDNNVWLTNDIDLTGKEWTPIGFYSDDDLIYTGVFNGNGFTVKNMTYTANTLSELLLCGLFGLSSAKIKAVNVTGNIDLSSPDNSRFFFVGGIVGYNQGGTVTDSTSAVNITIGMNVLSASDVGGIVGSNYGTISGCTNYGNIEMLRGNSSPIGGITALNVGTIDRCANYGSLSGATTYIGGIAGYSYEEFDEYEMYSVISNSYNRGTVERTGNLSNPYTGGIAGYMSNSKMSNCYNSGEIIGANTKGALIGLYADSGEINNCYFLDTSSPYGLGSRGWSPSYIISEHPDKDLGSVKTDTDMKTQAFVDSLNPDANTFLFNKDGYPVLAPSAMSVTIKTTPANASIIIKQGDKEIAPESDDSYLLLPGEYSITVSAENYSSKTLSTTVSLNQETHVITVNLDILSADYSAVKAAKAKIPSDLSIYTDESAAAVNKAVNAVVEGLDITKQSQVNDFAKAIEAAVNGLSLKTVIDNSGDTSETNSPEGSPNPATSDRSLLPIMLVIISVSILTMTAVKRCKLD